MSIIFDNPYFDILDILVFYIDIFYLKNGIQRF